MLSAAGFDGHIDIYSIMGGSNQAQSQRHADQVSSDILREEKGDQTDLSSSVSNLTVFTDQYLVWEHGSFWDGADFAPAAASPDNRPSSHSHPAEEASEVDPPTRRSLVRCECRSFSFHDFEDRASLFYHLKPSSCFVQFGGKLVSLENMKPNPQQPTAHVVHVSQVVTETAFLQRSEQLQATLSAGGFVDFCQEKIDAAANEFEKTLWSFLKVVKNQFLETFE